MPEPGPRVAVIGARRRRVGLGPFVIRELIAAGARVPCFLATSEATRDEAARAIEATCGAAPRGYLDLAEMLAREPLDALAILSPAETHAAYLEAAVEAGLHVLCEKPFVWGEADLAGRARGIVDAFAQRRLELFENCLWPYTLPAFAALHPGSLDAPPARFAMHLQPVGVGLQRLADALPHPLSLLGALVPGDAPRVHGIEFSSHDPEATSLEVRCRYVSAGHEVAVEIQLAGSEEWPRRPWIALDGRRAVRAVAPESYALSFTEGERRVPLPDPLPQLVGEFVTALAGGDPEAAAVRRHGIGERMRLLADFTAAWRGGAGG
jgi:hypothetical protein